MFIFTKRNKSDVMVIKTILDTDLYKFTTSYAYIKLFPYVRLLLKIEMKQNIQKVSWKH